MICIIDNRSKSMISMSQQNVLSQQTTAAVYISKANSIIIRTNDPFFFCGKIRLMRNTFDEFKPYFNNSSTYNDYIKIYFFIIRIGAIKVF